MEKENRMLKGWVTYEKESPERKVYIANLMYRYPEETETIELIPTGTIVYNNSFGRTNEIVDQGRLRDLREEQEIRAREARLQRRNTPEKPARERIDYINKAGNVRDFGVPQVNENIVMKAKKQVKPEKNYEEIANLFYPSMTEESQIQVKKKEPMLLGESSVLEEPDMITLADKEYVVKPLDGTFTGAAASVNININNVFNYNERTLMPEELKALGLKENENVTIKGKTLSPKKKNERYIEIDNVKFPKETTNKRIENIKQRALKDRRTRYKEYRDEFLKNHVHIEQMAVDNVDNWIILKIGKIKKGKESTENLYMSKNNSYLGTQYAIRHKILETCEELNDSLKDYIKEKVTEQVGTAKFKDTKGIYIEANTKSSKNLSDALCNEKKFGEKLIKWQKALRAGYNINETISFSNENWKNALGNADIREMHINKNGDIELYIADIYDFNEYDKRPLVMIGRDRQEKGEIKPYFIIYHVIIPKDAKCSTAKIIG